ncbi:MAG: hypothetical protein Q7S01_03060 [bacterium]|nr:hypothetical protein [bacterium]
MQTRIYVICLTVFLFSPTTIHAQFNSPSELGKIFISLTPGNPAPGENVQLSATSPLIDLARSDIIWYADKKVIAEGRGQIHAGVTAGPAGSETDIVVIAQSENASATGEAFLRPAEVGLMWESDSYTQPFYRGRALPSAGTKLRVQALARLVLPDGSSVPENEITYTWKRNGSVVGSVSGIGKSFAIFPSPSLFGTDIIEVEAASADGTRVGHASARIPSVEPVLALYEDHPLFGIMYGKALDKQISAKDQEMTFAAVPYFAQARSPDDEQFIYKWRVNGRDITADYARPSEITINSTDSSGEALLALTITRERNWNMKASGAWNILFPSGSGTPATDPFTSAQ